MTWLLTPFTALINWISQCLMNGAIDLMKHINGLNFNVLTMTNKNSGLVPGLSYINTIIMAIAWALFAMFLWSALIKMMTASMDGNYSSSPTTVVKRLFMAAVLIVAARPIMQLLFENLQAVLDGFLKYFDIAKDFSVDLSKAWFTDSDDSIISLLFSASIFFNVFTACINFVERYIMLYISYFLCPVAMSMYASEDNNTAVKEYFTSIFSQVVGILLNIAIFYCFQLKISSITMDNNDYFLLDWFIATALVSLAKNSEKILNIFGLHTLPSPTSARDFLGGFSSATSAIMGATGLARSGAQTVAGLGNIVSNGLTGVVSPTKLSDIGKMATDNGFIKGDNHVKSTSEMAKEAQKSNFNTTFDKNNKQNPFSYTGDFTDKDKKQVARELGATTGSNSHSAFMATGNVIKDAKGIKATNTGIEEAQHDMKTAIDKTNGFLRNDGSVNTLSNKDAAQAIGLEKTMPSFVPTPDGNVRRLKNGDIAMDGTNLSKGKDGTITATPVTYAFSDKESMPKVSAGYVYSKDPVIATSDGNLKAYEITGNGAVSPRSATSKMLDRDDLTSMLNPEVTMNGATIPANSCGYASSNGNVYFRALTENKDGSLSDNVWVATAGQYTNGQYIQNEGFKATDQRFELGTDSQGNDLYAVKVAPLPDSMYHERGSSGTLEDTDEGSNYKNIMNILEGNTKDSELKYGEKIDDSVAEKLDQMAKIQDEQDRLHDEARIAEENQLAEEDGYSYRDDLPEYKAPKPRLHPFTGESDLPDFDPDSYIKDENSSDFAPKDNDLR